MEYDESMDEPKPEHMEYALPLEHEDGKSKPWTTVEDTINQRVKKQKTRRGYGKKNDKKTD